MDPIELLNLDAEVIAEQGVSARLRPRVAAAELLWEQTASGLEASPARAH